MKRILSAGFALSLFITSAFAGGSTVNTGIPATGSPLVSAPIRNNFTAAATDINNLLSMFASSSAPASPVTFQLWANPAVNPAPISQFDGAQFVTIGYLDRVAHSFTPVVSATAIVGTVPVVSTVAGGVATISLNIDSNFAVAGGLLALNPLPAGNLLANCTGGSLEPTACSWNSFANQAVGSTNGMLPYRTGGNWGTISTGTSGGTLPLNNTANVFSLEQTVNLNATSAPAGQSGVGFQIVGIDATTVRAELDAFASVPRWTCVRKDGTNASPTTLQNADELCSLNAFGYNGTAVVGPQAALRTYAAQNWSVGANGTYLRLGVTANGGTTLTDALSVENDGGVVLGSLIGTGGNDKGAGTLDATALYVNAIQLATTGAAGTLLTGQGTGSTPTFSPTPTLGIAGSTLGTLSFANLTSGAETIQPATGALGSGVATLPAGTYTLAGLGLTQTFTSPNTFSNSSFNLTGLGSGLTCSNGLAVTSAGAVFLSSCPGAASSIQQGVTTVTSASASNEILTTGTVSGGTGTLTNIAVGGGLIISSGTLKLSLTSATFQSGTLSNLSGSTSTTGVMLGQGATCQITPALSGRVQFEFQGSLENGSTGDTTFTQLRFGTGTPPTNGTAIAGAGGTTIGSEIGSTIPLGSGQSAFKVGGVVTGLTTGTVYWFDISQRVNAGTASIFNASCNATES